MATAVPRRSQSRPCDRTAATSIGRDPMAVRASTVDLRGRMGIRASIKGWPNPFLLHLGARAGCAGFTLAHLRSSKLFHSPTDYCGIILRFSSLFVGYFETNKLVVDTYSNYLLILDIFCGFALDSYKFDWLF